MKIYKYILSFIVLAIGFTFCSELNLERISSSFGSRYPYITMDITNDNKKEVATEFCEAASENNVKAYIYVRRAETEYSISHTFYVVNGADKDLYDNFGFDEKTYKSVASGINTYCIKNLEEDTEYIYLSEDIYLIGDSIDVQNLYNTVY